jgi:hypothetical protein
MRKTILATASALAISIVPALAAGEMPGAPVGGGMGHGGGGHMARHGYGGMGGFHGGHMGGGWATTEVAEAGTAAEGTAGNWNRHGGGYGGGYGYSGGYWGSNGAWIPWAVGGALLGGAIAAGSRCPYGYYLASDYACYPY